MSNKTLQQIFYIQLADLNTRRYLKCWDILPQERKTRIETAPNFQKAVIAYSDLLVRYLTSNNFNIPTNKIVFEKGEYGKPYIREIPNFQFSVSHAGNLLVVFVSDLAVGVDTEKISTPNLQIATRFFTKNESDYIYSNPLLSAKRFYEIWTCKEAYIKYLGKGLSCSLSSFDVLKEIRDNFYIFELNGYMISAFSGNKVLHPYPVTQITEDYLIEALSSL